MSDPLSGGATSRDDDALVVESTRVDWFDDEPGYTETKSFFRTSEFWFAALGVAAVLLAAHIEGADSMTRDDGWRYATFILIGYMVSRGLAKAGTREPDRHH
jgi:hypothetical protein